MYLRSKNDITNSRHLFLGVYKVIMFKLNRIHSGYLAETNHEQH